MFWNMLWVHDRRGEGWVLFPVLPLTSSHPLQWANKIEKNAVCPSLVSQLFVRLFEAKYYVLFNVITLKTCWLVFLALLRIIRVTCTDLKCLIQVLTCEAIITIGRWHTFSSSLRLFLCPFVMHSLICFPLL